MSQVASLIWLNGGVEYGGRQRSTIVGQRGWRLAEVGGQQSVYRILSYLLSALNHQNHLTRFDARVFAITLLNWALDVDGYAVSQWVGSLIATVSFVCLWVLEYTRIASAALSNEYEFISEAYLYLHITSYSLSLVAFNVDDDGCHVLPR